MSRCIAYLAAAFALLYRMKIVVIGAGAAGLFAALRIAELQPQWRVQVLEQHKPLDKVRISGGGRCNVTHRPDGFHQCYPRGEQWMKKALQRWSATDTIRWYAERGVQLKTEEDGRMFPTTDSSQTIIDCLLGQAKKLGVSIRTGLAVRQLQAEGTDWHITLADETTLIAQRVLVATGGSPTLRGLEWLAHTGIEVVPPVPSLFTFNIDNSPLEGLQGISAEVVVSLQGTKLAYSGPLLITHKGVSGPAVLKLSAFAARHLHEAGYRCSLRVCWKPGWKDAQALGWIEEQRKLHPKKQVLNTPVPGLARRLWDRLCQLADIPEGNIWAELPAKNRNRLVELLLRTELPSQGKSTYKEEFVTAGGVALTAVDENLQCRHLPGLFFAGEVLDIDGITGGFNFQAAWTTGYIAANGIAG